MSSRNRPNPAAVFPVLAASTLLAAPHAASAHGGANLSAIKLIVERTVMRADGRNTCEILAQVFDERGSAAPDGTRVVFTTTMGRLDGAASVTRVTQGGVARVTLTSADQPGEAHISVVLDPPGQAIPATTVVTFSANAEASETGSSWAQISASGTVGYVLDYTTIQASGAKGGAALTYRALSLSADTIQLNTTENTIRAKGNVKISQGGQTRSYENFHFRLLTGEGEGERITDNKPQMFLVRGPKLEETLPGANDRILGYEDWKLEDLSGASITIAAKSIALEPSRRVQFRRATFYLDGKKTATLPFHILDLGANTLFQEQLVGFGATGVTFDLPLYYDVRPTGVGTLHFRRGAQVNSSAYATRAGWSIDAVQAYNGKNNMSGSVELNGLSRSDWGARLRHGQRLDSRTTGSLFVNFPNNQNLFVTSQASRSYKGFTVSALASGSHSPSYTDPSTKISSSSSGDIRGQLLAETNERVFWKSPLLRYVWNVSAARQTYFGSSTFARGVINTETTGGRLYTPIIPLARDLTLRQSFSLGRTWIQGGGSASGANGQGVTLLGTTSFDRTIPRLGSVAFSYDYAQTPLLGTGNSLYRTARHRVGVTANLSQGQNWRLYLNGSQGLDAAQSTANAVLEFPLSSPTRGRVTLTGGQVGGFGYQEIEYALIRTIAGRNVALLYSTTSKRFQLSLAGSTF